MFICLTVKWRICQKMFLFLHFILIVPLYLLSSWLTGGISKSLCWHVITLGHGYQGKPPCFTHIPTLYLSSMPPTPHPSLFVCLWNSSPALNYWPVWCPVRLGMWWVIVHLQQHRAIFLNPALEKACLGLSGSVSVKSGVDGSHWLLSKEKVAEFSEFDSILTWNVYWDETSFFIKCLKNKNKKNNVFSLLLFIDFERFFWTFNQLTAS